MVIQEQKNKCLELIPNLDFINKIEDRPKRIIYAELHLIDDFDYNDILKIAEVMKILQCDLEFESWYDLTRKLCFYKDIED